MVTSFTGSVKVMRLIQITLSGRILLIGMTVSRIIRTILKIAWKFLEIVYCGMMIIVRRKKV